MTLGVFRNFAGSQGGSTTPQAAITVPRSGGSAVQDTDYCVLFCFAGGGSNASAAPTVGTWTTHKSDTSFNGGGARYAIYGGVIGTATTITPSWPTAPTSGNNTAHLAVFFSGVNGSESPGTPNYPIAASVDAVAPGITTAGPDREVLAWAFSKGSSTGFPSSATWAGGFSAIASQYATANFNGSIVCARLDKATQGSTADQTATWNFSTLNEGGIQMALTPSVLSLAVTLDVVPSSGANPLGVTATGSSTGGNGNPKTYSMDWDDGSTSGSQSSNVFTHTYTAVGEYDPVITVSQS